MQILRTEIPSIRLGARSKTAISSIRRALGLPVSLVCLAFLFVARDATLFLSVHLAPLRSSSFYVPFSSRSRATRLSLSGSRLAARTRRCRARGMQKPRRPSRERRRVPGASSDARRGETLQAPAMAASRRRPDPAAYSGDLFSCCSVLIIAARPETFPRLLMKESCRFLRFCLRPVSQPTEPVYF